MDVLYWVVGFVVLVPILFWFRRATLPPPKVKSPVSAEQAKMIAELDADSEWINAYRKLPEEEQAKQREGFNRRMLDHAERALTLDAEILGQPESPALWATRRTKELIAVGKSFDDASAQAMDEMDIKFPPKQSTDKQG